MKITRIQTQVQQHESVRLLGDVNSPLGTNLWSYLAIMISTDEGLFGTSITLPAAEKMVHELTPLLIGEDPRSVKGLYKKMVDYVFKSSCRGISSEAIAGLDIALWDLKAKFNGEPLYRTLGASTNKVKAYASDVSICISDDELKKFYSDMSKLGITLGKVKVGLNQEFDINRLKIAQEALSVNGKKGEVAIDSNEYWSPKESIRRIREIEEEIPLIWAEEPARRWDHQGLKKVSDSITAAVASGENLKTVTEFVPHLTNGAMDIVQIGNYTSGITGAMHVAELAYAFERPVCVMGSLGDFMGHFAAALPNHMMIEVAKAWENWGYTVDNKIEDGWLIMGDSPGLGITFSEELLTKFRNQEVFEQKSFRMRTRREGAGLYVVPLGMSVNDHK
ncbi:MAG: mandelate racemase/muconate lactonizing enzyme family protein [Bacteroidales bacterium]|nr:mandelate racemase/muconate lactonizing enzyme family protein [Bacteroidales bacterium]